MMPADGPQWVLAEWGPHVGVIRVEGHTSVAWLAFLGVRASGEVDLSMDVVCVQVNQGLLSTLLPG